MQGTQVQSLVQEDPKGWSNLAHVPEAQAPRARALQQEKPLQ